MPDLPANNYGSALQLTVEQGERFNRAIIELWKSPHENQPDYMVSARSHAEEALRQIRLEIARHEDDTREIDYRAAVEMDLKKLPVDGTEPDRLP